jgi:hypothetical protein
MDIGNAENHLRVWMYPIQPESIVMNDNEFDTLVDKIQGEVFRKHSTAI